MSFNEIIPDGQCVIIESIESCSAFINVILPKRNCNINIVFAVGHMQTFKISFCLVLWKCSSV